MYGKGNKGKKKKNVTYSPSNSELCRTNRTDSDIVGSVGRRRLDRLKPLGGFGGSGRTDNVSRYQPQSVLHERG